MRRLVKKANMDYLDICQGDLVDFGPYGRLYVCNPDYDTNAFWVTDREEDRDDPHASGWSISKNFAKRMIESFEDANDYEDEDEDEEEDDEY